VDLDISRHSFESIPANLAYLPRIPNSTESIKAYFFVPTEL